MQNLVKFLQSCINQLWQISQKWLWQCRNTTCKIKTLKGKPCKLHLPLRFPLSPYCLHYFFLRGGKNPKQLNQPTSTERMKSLKKKMPFIKCKQQSVKGNLPGIINTYRWRQSIFCHIIFFFLISLINWCNRISTAEYFSLTWWQWAGNCKI